MTAIPRYSGVIVASDPPSGPVASPGVTYSVEIDWDMGNGQTFARRFDGIQPHDGRWDETWSIAPAKPGTHIDAIDHPTGVRFLFCGAEKLWPLECGAEGAQQEISLTARIREIVGSMFNRRFGRSA